MRTILLALTMPLLFSQPVQFSEAAQSVEARRAIATTLSHAELEALGADIREHALLLARVSDLRIVNRALEIIKRYEVDGDLATARRDLRDFLDEINFQPSAEDAGTIKDITTEERINLIIETPARMAWGYGGWIQGQTPAILRRWPAQELYRAYPRKTHRQWSGEDNGEIIKGEPTEGRWVEHGGQIYDGRMIAKKNDPIWTNISRFELPYPPFDFNSGMDVRDVNRETALSLGVIERDTVIAPQQRDFAQDLKFSTEIRDAALRQVMEELGYHFEGDVLNP